MIDEAGEGSWKIGNLLFYVKPQNWIYKKREKTKYLLFPFLEVKILDVENIDSFKFKNASRGFSKVCFEIQTK